LALQFFWQNDTGAKAAHHKMLVKSITGLIFISKKLYHFTTDSTFLTFLNEKAF